MKIIDKVFNSVLTYTIDYENGFYCRVKVINGKLDHYCFYTTNWVYKEKQFGSTILDYLTYRDIDFVKNNHWSEHSKIKRQLYKTEDSLKSFNKFEKLYYLGCGYDGLVMDYKGKIVSSIILIGDTHAKVYCEINTLEKSKSFKEKADKIEWVKKCDIVEIPYYNRDDYKDTHSVKLEVLLPQKKLDYYYNNLTKESKDLKTFIFEEIINS